MNDAKDEFHQLEKLLTLWKLPQLCAHLKEEGINIEELQMMKAHHVDMLLVNFKLGIRIRFEHNFELWRKNLNKPLKCNRVSAVRVLDDLKSATAAECNNAERHNKQQAIATTTNTACKVSRSTNTPLATDFLVDLVEPASKSDAVPIANTISDSSMTLSRLPTNLRQPAPGCEIKQPLAVAQAPVFEHNMLLDNPCRLDDSLDHEANFRNIDFRPTITLAEILNKSGVRGAALCDYYRQHRQFTDKQRAQLITVIVTHFESNEFHLSLKMSYYMELQITKMFPTEKIEYYRTEKRGKIYMKYCNLKRYRRETRKREHTVPHIEAEDSKLPEDQASQQDMYMHMPNYAWDASDEQDGQQDSSTDVHIKDEYMSD